MTSALIGSWRCQITTQILESPSKPARLCADWLTVCDGGVGIFVFFSFSPAFGLIPTLQWAHLLFCFPPSLIWLQYLSSAHNCTKTVDYLEMCIIIMSGSAWTFSNFEKTYSVFSLFFVYNILYRWRSKHGSELCCTGCPLQWNTMPRASITLKSRATGDQLSACVPLRWDSWSHQSAAPEPCCVRLLRRTAGTTSTLHRVAWSFWFHSFSGPPPQFV